MYLFLFKTQPKATYRSQRILRDNVATDKKRAEQHVATKAFKYWKGTSPFYANVLFVSSRNTQNTRSHMALEKPLKKSNLGYKTISFIGQSIWDKLSNNLKILNNDKKLVLQNLSEQNIIFIITFIIIIIIIIIIIAIIIIITIAFVIIIINIIIITIFIFIIIIIIIITTISIITFRIIIVTIKFRFSINR